MRNGIRGDRDGRGKQNQDEEEQSQEGRGEGRYSSLKLIAMLTYIDIWNRRASKVRDGLRTIGAETSGVQLSNITAMEINKIRPFISKSMDQFYLLSQKTDDQPVSHE